MSQSLTVLGGITAEQFLTEYWQKKPLLVRNAMPEIIGLLEPDDVKELALDEDISARLIRQKNKNPNEYSIQTYITRKSKKLLLIVVVKFKIHVKSLAV